MNLFAENYNIGDLLISIVIVVIILTSCRRTHGKIYRMVE